MIADQYKLYTWLNHWLKFYCSYINTFFWLDCMNTLKKWLTSPENMYSPNQDERRQEILSQLSKVVEDEPPEEVYKQL